MSVKIKYSTPAGVFEKAFYGSSQKIIEAAHDAIAEAGSVIKTKARSDIISSGLGQGFVNALRVDIYPKQRKSINASAHVYHKIPYAGVFEEGATIRGRPFLWIPMSLTPKKIGRERMTAQLFEQRIAPLDFVKQPGHRPLLVAKMKAGRSKTVSKITLPRLRAAANSTDGPFISVPLFVGINTVNVRKRLNIGKIVRNARDSLVQLYAKNIGAKL